MRTTFNLDDDLLGEPQHLTDFIERRSLMGRGIGLVDVHLLASASLAAPARLWTRDRRLATVVTTLDFLWR